MIVGLIRVEVLIRRNDDQGRQIHTLDFLDESNYNVIIMEV